METTVISVLALSYPVPEAKYLANPSVLEPALKVEPVATVSDLVASQLTEVGIIPAFGPNSAGPVPNYMDRSLILWDRSHLIQKDRTSPNLDIFMNKYYF